MSTTAMKKSGGTQTKLLSTLMLALVALAVLATSCGSSGTESDAADISSAPDAAVEDASTDTNDTDDAAEPSPGEPIKVGNISSLSGGATFLEAAPAAAAVFERINANGGINGRPIEFIIEDDGGSPEGAGGAAAKLINQDQVVAMAGSASALECVVNAGTYAENGVYSVQAVGVDPVCFLSPNISPVNTGPYNGVTVALYYASETLGLDNVCNVNLFVVPDLAPAFDAAVDRWEDLTGNSIHFRTKAATLEDDPTPLLLQARDAGCEAVIIDGVTPHALAVGAAIEAQDLTDMRFIALTSYYEQSIADALGSSANGLEANSEFEPFGSDSAALDDWRNLMSDAGVPLTSFAQAGYLSATIFGDILMGIEGEVTRESVATALLSLEPVETPFLAAPYTFGDAPAHAPNQASKFVVLNNGEWTTSADDWVVLPS